MKRPSTWVTKTVLPSGPPKVRFDGFFPSTGISGRAVPSAAITAMLPALGRATKILPSTSVRRPSSSLVRPASPAASNVFSSRGASSLSPSSR
jgi:hypothetical protein